MRYFTDESARSIIRKTYDNPPADGRAVAEALYGADELSAVPEDAIVHAFGVGHPVRHAHLRAAEVVLDVGCGAGIDTLLAARQVGAEGRVLALDMTAAMLARTRRHATQARLTNVETHEGLMEALPFAEASVDVVICNGMLNLSTRQSRALAEMLRVLRPGGRVCLADLVLGDRLPEEILKNPIALAV
jgi:SAM-dependent methyltransferase